MSLILDALRRAESERQRGAVPGLHDQPQLGNLAETDSAAWSPAGEGVRRPLPWVLAGALLALGAGLLWWRWPVVQPLTPAPAAALPQAATPQAMPPVANPPVATPVPEPAIAVPAPVVVPVPAPMTTAAAPNLAPIAAPVAAPVAIKAQAAATPASTQAPTTQRLPTLAELPEGLRRELPALALGGVMYAEQPALRMVIINGQLFHEGDKPAGELQVQQIRHKSVVFNLRGTRFEMAL